jgi:CheY-like chemotaxis protein
MGAILIVDDNVDACRPLRRLLIHLGHAAECRDSGEAALDYLSKSVPDLMILDAMMPGMDGLEVLRRVRGAPETSALPVVMFSAISDPAFREHALSKGANDYWTKASFDFAQLKVKVESLIMHA